MRILLLPIMLVVGAVWLVTLPIAFIHDQCRAVLDPFGEM